LRWRPVSGSELKRIANMRPAIALPSAEVNGKGVHALIAASRLLAIFSLRPSCAGARTYVIRGWPMTAPMREKLSRTVTGR
jgi:hypothetical protein